MAIFTFSADSPSRLAVFIGSAGALVLISLQGVVFGSVVHKLVPPQMIKTGAAVLFIALGLGMLIFSGEKQ